MRLSGITIIKDGITYDYPFVEAIRSALPIVDEFVVVVGKSSDGTREKVEAIDSPKIRIVDTVWDEQLRMGGKVLAQQTNIGLDAAQGDWILYLQGDELIHEQDHDALLATIERHDSRQELDGLLFPYYHFWGYQHTIVTRRTYRREVRLVRNNPLIRSYRDAQGFRKYPSLDDYTDGHPGIKLQVALIQPHIYAYSRVRPPQLEYKKNREFARLWHDDEYVEEKFAHEGEWDYSNIDHLVPFDLANHPAVIQPRAQASDLNIDYQGPKWTFKSGTLYWIERTFGWRIGEYRNYQLVR